MVPARHRCPGFCQMVPPTGFEPVLHSSKGWGAAVTPGRTMSILLPLEAHENIVCHDEWLLRDLSPPVAELFLPQGGEAHKFCAPFGAKWCATNGAEHGSGLMSRGCNALQCLAHPPQHLFRVVHGHGCPKVQNRHVFNHQNVAATKILFPGLFIVMVFPAVNFKP